MSLLVGERCFLRKSTMGPLNAMKPARSLRHFCWLGVLLLALQPLAGQAQFTLITNADNTLTIARYTGSGGHVIIPSTTNSHPVTTIGSYAFWNNPKMTNVTIPNSINC